MPKKIQKPRLIAIGGLSGSGKSTLARNLFQAIPNSVWIRSDVIRKQLWGVSETDKLPEEAYTVEWHQKVTAEMQAQMRAAVLDGKTVINDATFRLESARLAMEEFAAQELHVPFKGLFLMTDIEISKKRVAARTGDVSDATPEIVELQYSDFDPQTVGWTKIDASQSPEVVVSAAQKALDCSPVQVIRRKIRPKHGA